MEVMMMIPTSQKEMCWDQNRTYSGKTATLDIVSIIDFLYNTDMLDSEPIFVHYIQMITCLPVIHKVQQLMCIMSKIVFCWGFSRKFPCHPQGEWVPLN